MKSKTYRAGVLGPSPRAHGGETPGAALHCHEADIGHVAAREALYLGNISHVIDRLQELFDHWETQHTFSPPASADMLCRARLAVHEWVANLIQHADFEDRVPEIALSLWASDARLCCIICDNSEGFDPDLNPSVTLEEVCDRLPERGMGLLLLRACADDVRYESVGTAGHRVAFAISEQGRLGRG